jgi:tetratricopeptide (TPR) repeat protein
LTGFGELFVFGPETSFDIDRLDAKSAELTKPDYVLSGSVHATDTVVRVSAILSESRTGQYVWSTDLERDLTTVSLIELEADIAGQVAGAIAQPYGVMFNRTAAEIASKPAGSFMSYECVVKFREYWRVYDKLQFDEVRGCLERTIEADARYARAYSSLALLNIDAHRFGFGGDTFLYAPLERALQMAQKSIELEPGSADGYLALSMAYWFSGDADRSIQAARQGLDLNPHNSDLLGELGLRYALLAKWDESAPLIAEAYARNPAAPSGYRIAAFLNSYMRGDYSSALQQALQVNAPYVLYGHMARAMAYAQLGDSAKAAASVIELLRIDPEYADHIAEDLGRRFVDPSIVQAVVDGLAKAGLRTPPASVDN